jgi:branched-chain amino acid aminotransferase
MSANSNLVAVEPGAIRQATAPGSVIQYSDYELYDADELIAVTTAGGITPIVSLDGEPVGDGEPGPLTVALRDRFWAELYDADELIESIAY